MRSPLSRSSSSSSFGSSSSEHDSERSQAEDTLLSVNQPESRQEQLASQEEVEVALDSTMERRMNTPQFSLTPEVSQLRQEMPDRSSASPMFDVSLSSPDSMKSTSLSSLASNNRTPEPTLSSHTEPALKLTQPALMTRTPEPSLPMVCSSVIAEGPEGRGKPALPPKPRSPYIDNLLAQKRKVRSQLIWCWSQHHLANTHCRITYLYYLYLSSTFYQSISKVVTTRLLQITAGSIFINLLQFKH